MAGRSAYDPETGIRVLIKPSQSSFFAGEPFSVSITFINTRIPPEQSRTYNPSSQYLDPLTFPSSANGASKPPTPSTSSLRPYSHSHSPSQSALPSPTLGPQSLGGANPDIIASITTKRYHHKRGAHSISSAPLYRPPTSPGIPRSPVPSHTPSGISRVKGSTEQAIGGGAEGVGTLTRKGMIGTGNRGRVHSLSISGLSMATTPSGFRPRSASASASPSPASAAGTSVEVSIKVATPVSDSSVLPKPNQSPNQMSLSGPVTSAPTLPELIEQRRKRQLGKSLSVAVSPPPKNEFQYGAYQPSSPSTPQSTSWTNGELKRTHTLALSKSHPHARKDSVVLDGSNSATFLDGNFPPTPQPSASIASFPDSYPLSAIVEASPQGSLFSGNRSSAGQPSVPNSPMLGAPYMESGSSTPAHGHPFQPSKNGLGIGHPSNPYKPNPSYGPDDTGEELILYSYAQLVGQVIITPPFAPNSSSATQPSREQRAAMFNLREKLLKKGKGGVVGGGSMDINSMLGLSSPDSGKSYASRTPSSASALSRSSSDGQRHNRTTSLSGSLFALLSPSSLMGLGGSDNAQEGEGLVQGNGLKTAPPGTGWTTADQPPGPQGHGIGLGLSNGQQPLKRLNRPMSPPLAKSYSHDHPASLSHGRKSSISAFFGLTASESTEAAHSSAPLPRVRGSGFLAVGSGSSNGAAEREEVEEENAKYDYCSFAPLPTLETQPAMLAVDLRLRPGEEKSYTYTLQLPDNLPPTFRGKSLKFSYELAVGLCRAGPGTSKHNISKLMKVPVRLYNCVWVDRPLKVYSLISPIHRRMDMAMPSSQAQVIDSPIFPSEAPSSTFGVTSARRKERTPLAPAGTKQEIKEYARRLVASLPDAATADHRAEGQEPAMDNDLKARARRHTLGQADEDSDEPAVGCREAVELLTRTPKKASYDVTKDGVKVAVLTLSKSSFRLGETVSGVIELNERSSRARVIQLAAFLEAHEALPSTISPQASNKSLKRTYAEHYTSMLINTARTTFSLDIPSDASPAFQTSLGTTATPGGLQQKEQLGGVEWKLRLNLLVAVASEYAELGTEGVRLKSLLRDGTRGEWSSSWKALHVVKPLQKMGPMPTPVSPTSSTAKAMNNSPYNQGRSGSRTTSNSSWSAFFASYIMPVVEEKQYHDGDELDDDDADENTSRSTNSLPVSRTGTRTSLESSSYASSNASIPALGNAQEPEVYDGIKPDPAGGVGAGVNFEGGNVDWTEVPVETVECEVPVRVWPGNTAFRAQDIVFEV